METNIIVQNIKPFFQCHKRYQSTDKHDLTTKELEYLAQLNEISIYSEFGSKKKVVRHELCTRLAHAGLITYLDLEIQEDKGVPRISRHPDFMFLVQPVGRFIAQPIERTLPLVNRIVHGGHVYKETL